MRIASIILGKQWYKQQNFHPLYSDILTFLNLGLLKACLASQNMSKFVHINLIAIF